MMMEAPQSLTLNEEALQQIPDHNKPVYIFEWLRYLDKVLVTAQKSDIKACQKKLVEQLTTHIQGSPGPPTRKLLASCLSTLFSVGDTFLLFDTVNKCNDILKNKDDSPSFLPTKLAAISCVGSMYEKLGRMMGRSYEETVQILIKSLKSAESQMRIEIMVTLEKVCCGMDTAISNVHKEIYKATKYCLTDRVMPVRVAAAKCLIEMMNHAPFLYTTELENMAALCFRAFDGSNYEVRCAVANLLGSLIAFTQQQQHQVLPKGVVAAKIQAQTRQTSLDEAFGLLMLGFLRGGASFLKGTGEMIKGSSSVAREVRVGVTHAYVVFSRIMGGNWLEKNLQTFLNHVLDLVANPKAASSHVDAVYSRKCINFILRSTVGKLLSEKAQSSTCKEIVHIIAKQMSTIDFNPENAKDSNQETLFSQHLLVCALQELGNLVMGLGTTSQNLLSDQHLIFVDSICAVLIHPCAAARSAAAWCLRCVCVAVPSQITPLIDRFVEKIEDQTLRSSPEAISGYSSALASVLGTVRLSPLGIPHTKGKIVFITSERLLRSASQNSRLSLQRTQAGWLLIGAIMTLGVPVVKGLLPHMSLLWRNSFPRSGKEMESEKARGDAFTWQVTFENRAGALSAMHSFFLHCPELLTDDITKRLLPPIESCLAMLVNLTPVLKSYGQQLKAPAAMVRLRLYETLTLLPINSLESSYTHLLRMLVAEFTLTENPANTTNSLLRDLCHSDDSIILGTWLQETDHKTIEDQLQPNSAAGSGALEHDLCCLYRPLPKSQTYPGPLPLGVAVIDRSVTLFGSIFPRVANKHRIQMFEHFAECIKHAKSLRQEAVQMNIFAALLSGLKGLSESKSTIGQEEVKKSATTLVTNALVCSNSILRCAAAEALGRIAQVVSDSKFTAELAQTSFDKLKLARDVVTRTGHSLALGCLHKYVGGMGSSQHLSTSVSILLALAQDGSSPVVQAWSLYALSLIADSGGLMFRAYVEPTLSLSIKLLLTVPQSFVDVHQCIGRVLAAIITTMGPELQGNTASIATMRSSLLCACAIMQSHCHDPLVQAEATGCLQQLHLFAPKNVNLTSLVLSLCKTLSNNYLMLRKAAVACLRQLAQREAKEICEHALNLSADDPNAAIVNESGLPGVLFAMLDTETDAEMIKNIHDTLNSMLQMLASDNLSQWLTLCKNVLTVANDTITGPGDELSAMDNLRMDDDNEDDDDDNDDDVADFQVAEEKTSHSNIQPRWPTRVFAAECIRKIINTCESANPLHFDLIQAKELQMTKSRGDYLILHLSDLIRMAFMAATSDCDPLRLEGLKTLQEIIDKFARIPEPEFPGHLLLEQFQAQVGAAIRPAFSSETPSHVTAAACEVCSAWIGSGVARDLSDLRRVHQLLVISLSKLHTKTVSTELYNESMATLEKLSILKAWAEVYIVSMIGNGFAPASLIMKKLSNNNMNYTVTTTSTFTTPSASIAAAGDDDFGEFESRGESLLSLVKPELENLSQHWLAALKDHALLQLPPEFASQLPHNGGAFYTNETMNSSKPHYLSAWPQILYAASLWLNSTGFNLTESDHSTEENTQKQMALNNNPITHGSVRADRFHLAFGISMEAICNTRSGEKLDAVLSCLKSMYTLFHGAWAREQLFKDRALAIELCNVLHRMILIRDSLEVQLLCIEILKRVIEAAKEALDREKETKLAAIEDNELKTDMQNELDLLGEGGENGEIVPGQSVAYAVLEVCLCLFVRQIPSMNPSTTLRLTNDHLQNQIRVNANGTITLAEDNGMLVALALQCLENLMQLCSPMGAMEVVSSVLYLTTGVIKEIAKKSSNDPQVIADTSMMRSALHCIKEIATDKYVNDERCKVQMRKLLESTLACLIDLSKTGSDDTKTDEVTMMLGIALFILHAPSIVSTPNLKFPSINHFQQCLQCESNPLVKLKCIQTVRSIFVNAETKVATPYIHALAPKIVEALCAPESKEPKNDIELNILLESITTVEALITLTEPQNRIQLLSVLVPILISFLLDANPMRISSKYSRQLHEQSLQRLMRIGPKYPQEFKAMMSQSIDLRSKLEAAVKLNQENANSKQRSHIANQTQSNQPKPTIELKTNFSNFSSN